MKLETRRIADVDIVSWLDQRGAVGDSDKKSCGIMRMVWVNRDVNLYPWKCEISKRNQELVLERFEVKRARQLVPDGGFICLPAEDRQALWWGDNDYALSPRILNVLKYQTNLVGHPMFMALVAAIIILQSSQDAIELNRDKINRVEHRTQHSHFHSSKRPIAAGSYASLSAMMSGSATHLAGIETTSGTLREILDALSEYQWPQDVERPEWAGKVVKEVDECVKVLRQRLKAQELKIRYLSRRADVQLTALFNLITQRETRLSISVAQDSRTLASVTKDDSTAMKALTAVTVVFLPGTFSAAFFSMPLFQWETHKTRRHRARDSEGKEALDHEINGPQQELREMTEDVLDDEKGLKEE
ncbi:MAG: hypothetical protein Q9164_004579 [Protoblastenia rupestris]